MGAVVLVPFCVLSDVLKRSCCDLSFKSIS
jgi:hypothetical protein